MSATDLELGINYWVGAKIEEDGSLALPSRLTTEFISNIKEDKVSIKSQGVDVSIEGEKYNATIKGIESEDYPLIPDITKDFIFSVSTKDLQTAISQVAFSSAADNARPVLSGVYFSFDKDTLKMAATDSYRLAEKTIKVVKGEKVAKNFIVPSRAIMELGKLLKDSGDKVEVCFDGNQVLFSLGSIHLVSRLIDGQYPNYTQIIPTDFESEIEVDKEELFTVCKVASLFARESANSIKINIKPDKNKEGVGILAITGQGNQIGESTSKITVKALGKELEVSFNAKYILDVLPNILEKKIKLKLAGKINPCLIQGDGKQDYTYVIMPLRA